MLVLIPRSGVSGDMLLSALIDLGADEEMIAKTLKKELGVRIRTERTSKLGFRARKLIVPDTGKRYSPRQMRALISRSKLGKETKTLCLRVLETLIEAERKAHGDEDVHFHELSSVDTLVDIMGCALALDSIGEKDVYSLPLAVGRIAPAALSILTDKRVPFYGGNESLELTTPTGAAIVPNIAKGVEEMPLVVPEGIGCGAGGADRDDEPNVLRIVRGRKPERTENIVVLETNIDDASGEVLAYAVERLLSEGAKDACMIPIIAKKGRPGVILRAICGEADVEKLVMVIFEETGTLGIRETRCGRHIASRSLVLKRGKHGSARVKVGRYGGKVISSKPEFEDLKRIAKQRKRSIRDVSKSLR